MHRGSARKQRLGHQLDGLSSLAQRMVESDGQPGEEAFATARLTSRAARSTSPNRRWSVPDGKKRDQDDGAGPGAQRCSSRFATWGRDRFQRGFGSWFSAVWNQQLGDGGPDFHQFEPIVKLAAAPRGAQACSIGMGAESLRYCPTASQPISLNTAASLVTSRVWLAVRSQQLAHQRTSKSSLCLAQRRP